MGYEPEEDPQIVPRSPSLLECDIRIKVGEYFEGTITLSDLFFWLSNPLLLWEMIEQVPSDPALYALVIGLHRILRLYNESKDTEEGEILLLLLKLVGSEEER